MSKQSFVRMGHTTLQREIKIDGIQTTMNIRVIVIVEDIAITTL